MIVSVESANMYCLVLGMAGLGIVAVSCQRPPPPPASSGSFHPVRTCWSAAKICQTPRLLLHRCFSRRLMAFCVATDGAGGASGGWRRWRRLRIQTAFRAGAKKSAGSRRWLCRRCTSASPQTSEVRLQWGSDSLPQNFIYVALEGAPTWHFKMLFRWTIEWLSRGNISFLDFRAKNCFKFAEKSWNSAKSVY